MVDARRDSSVFTVFVNNLPPKVHWRWVKTVFQKFGRVVDIFLPRKNSRNGHRFGFVRYVSIADAHRAQWNLNGVWFLDYKIRVYLAKYNPMSAFWRKTKRKLSVEVANEMKGPCVPQ
ncbi:hypothetical protein REPUB_Repub11eG0075800 [Reevesia pubescens]